MTEPRIPVFRCELSDDSKQVSFWCPYCLIEHRHGWDPESKRGLRNKSSKRAHCVDSYDTKGKPLPPSPLKETGYFVFVPARGARTK